MSTLTYKLAADDRELLQALMRSAEGFKKISDRAKDVETATNKISQSALKVGDAWKTVSGAVAGYLSIGAVNQYLQEVGRMVDLSDRLGMSVESWQKLSFAVGQFGADGEQVARAMTKITASLNEGGDKAETFAQSLKALGINVTDFKAMNADEQFYALADAFEATGGNADAFSEVLDIIGIKAADLVPALRQGGDALREMADSIMVIDEEKARRIDDFGDSILRLKQNLMALAAVPMDGIAKIFDPKNWDIPTGLLTIVNPFAGAIQIAQNAQANELEAANEAAIKRANAKNRYINRPGKQTVAKYDAFDVLPPEENIVGEPMPLRTVNEKWNKRLMQEGADLTEAEAQARIDALKVRVDAAKESYDLLSKQKAEFGNLRQDIVDRTKFFGDPKGLALNQRANEISGSTGIPFGDAMAMAQNEVSTSLAEADLMQKRHFEIAQKRRNRRDAQRGRDVIRARRFNERQKGGLMDSKPFGIPQDVWDQIQAEGANAVDLAQRGGGAKQKWKELEKELMDAQQELPVNVLRIKEAIGGGPGNTVVKNLEDLNDKIKKIAKL